MIRLRILGPIELEDSAGRELEAVVLQPKRLALLVYLAAAERGFHRRDTLLALFWPERDEAHARAALNQAIRFLRRELGRSSDAEVIVSRGAGEIGIDPTALSCDARLFADAVRTGRHAAAMELYRADLLQGFFAEGAPGFAEWVDRERARLRVDAARCARALAEAHEKEGRYTTAVSSARRAVDLSDADERVVRDLLALLDRLGDRAGAIRAYEAFSRRLANEFDTGPAAETAALVDRIRARSTPQVGSFDDVSPVASRLTATAPGAPLTPHSEPTLERWRVERELARGSVATVYLARDTRHDRHVALKALPLDLLAPDGAQRFLQEIQITASLAHPHILPLIDSGAVNGILYLVTPYIDGESLRGRLEREPRLAVADALQIGAEIAEALDYAHRRGVVHRDIKPENILLADDHAVVADFGVARALASSGVLAEIPTEDPGAIVGSRGYMSPEQAAGEADVGARSDIYSLGCVLCELVTGRLPSGGESPDSIAGMAPETPMDVARIISDCVALSADRRPESASAVLRSVRAAATPETPAGPAATAGKGVHVHAPLPSLQAARNPWVAIGAIVITMVGLALVVTGPSAESRPASVALVAFQNVTGDTAFDAVGGAMTRSIAAGLAEVGTVDVIPVGESDADAAFAVSGSYHRRGDSLEFLLAITDRARGRALPPPDPVRAPARDPLAAAEALQHRAMGAVAYYTSIFGVDSTPERRPPAYPAYLAFAEGLAATFRFDWSTAESGFRRALDLDPSYTEAYMMLGRTFMNQAGKTRQRGGKSGRLDAIDSLANAMRQTIRPLTDPDRSVFDYLKAYAEGDQDRVVDATLRLAERFPAANYSIGFHSNLANRPRSAIRGLERLDPDKGWTREWSPYWAQLGAAWHQLGEYEEEQRAAQAARRRFPHDTLVLQLLLRTMSTLGTLDRQWVNGLSGDAVLRFALELRAHGHHERSGELLRHVLDFDTANRTTTADRVRVSQVLLVLGRLDEAVIVLEEAAQLDTMALDLKGMLATAYARQGKRTAAEGISEDLASVREAYLQGLPSLWRARIAARLGDREAAVRLLGQAFQEGVSFHPLYPAHRGSFWHTDPDFEALWGYGPFRELIRPR